MQWLTGYDIHQTRRRRKACTLLRSASSGYQNSTFECLGSNSSASQTTSLAFFQRNCRPPTDPVNALLSLTYTLAQQEAIRQCTAAGLDPQLGFYHRTAYGRYSLACDLMEPVRPYCEQWVFSQFMQGNFNRKHFNQPSAANPACLLGKRGRELYYQAIAEQLPHWRQHLQASARWLTRQLHQTPPQPEQQP